MTAVQFEFVALELLDLELGMKMHGRKSRMVSTSGIQDRFSRCRDGIHSIYTYIG